ncbi:hypothetical protein [Limnobacter sp.]|uniref:hypothetical protein n=1 Tax=Limnobacter sp. TaxID=2003368 RepID=UPI0035165D62
MVAAAESPTVSQTDQVPESSSESKVYQDPKTGAILTVSYLGDRGSLGVEGTYEEGGVKYAFKTNQDGTDFDIERLNADGSRSPVTGGEKAMVRRGVLNMLQEQGGEEGANAVEGLAHSAHAEAEVEVEKPPVEPVWTPRNGQHGANMGVAEGRSNPSAGPSGSAVHNAESSTSTPGRMDIRHNGTHGGFYQADDGNGYQVFGIEAGRKEGMNDTRNKYIRSEAAFTDMGFAASDNVKVRFQGTYNVDPGTSGVIAQLLNNSDGEHLPQVKIIYRNDGELVVDVPGQADVILPGHYPPGQDFNLAIESDGKTFQVFVNGQMVHSGECITPGGVNVYKMGLYGGSGDSNDRVRIKDASVSKVDSQQTQTQQEPQNQSGGRTRHIWGSTL